MAPGLPGLAHLLAHDAWRMMPGTRMRPIGKVGAARLTSECQPASNRTQLPIACAIDKRPMRWATYAGAEAASATTAPNSGMSHFNTPL